MTNTNTVESRKARPRKPVKVIVKREFVGEKPLAEVLLPVLFESIRKQAEQIGTFALPTDTK
jgi:hypothetical protein